MPQLDALRAIAVIGVLASHFCRRTLEAFPVGHLGVWLFFVLSGFLITGILLRCRAVVDGGQPVAFTLRQFYARRFLRIAPLYYGVLLVAWLAGVPEIHAAPAWHLAYLSNVYFTRVNAWQGPLSHLWSLAVEEQFYLVWPALILLVPRQRLVPAVVTLCAIGPLWRVGGAFVGLPDMARWTLPFGSLDALGFGALLALVTAPTESPTRTPTRAPTPATRDAFPEASVALGTRRPLPFPRWLAWATVASLVILAWYYGRWTARPAKLFWIMTSGLVDSVWAVLLGALVLGAARGFRGPVGRVLAWRPLSYVGRISYGVYLIHLFMLDAVPRALAIVGLRYPSREAYQFVYLSAATLVLATLSWVFYERPLNALKRWFPYVSRRSPAPETGAGLAGVRPFGPTA